MNELTPLIEEYLQRYHGFPVEVLATDKDNNDNCVVHYGWLPSKERGWVYTKKPIDLWDLMGFFFTKTIEKYV